MADLLYWLLMLVQLALCWFRNLTDYALTALLA